MHNNAAIASVLAGWALVGCGGGTSPEETPVIPRRPVAPQLAVVVPVPGMPTVPDRTNLYSEAAAGRVSAAASGAAQRVYVPNRSDHSVSVIDAVTLKVIDTFKVGVQPQHVIPSWDLRTLWVVNHAEGRTSGSLTPIDPKTGKPGPSITVDEPDNVYWSPDGRHAIVVAKTSRRLDFRDARTMKLEHSIPTPQCGGINHGDFSIDGRFALFTCEVGASVTKIDLVTRRVAGTLKLSRYFDRPKVLASFARAGSPQDIRASPDGRLFLVADLTADGVHVVEAEPLRQVGFIATGTGAHGLIPGRDAKSLYVANRGSHKIVGPRGGKGSVSVIDFATLRLTRTWRIPGGGSPDTGGLSADGRHLWLSGRFDDVVYRIDTGTGRVDKIEVGREPHGLTVWPQPGRYALGHTGNLR